MRVVGALAGLILVAEMLAGSTYAQQTGQQNPDPAKQEEGRKSCQEKTSERALIHNVLCDQKTILRAPLHSGSHLGFVIPFAVATAGLIATDKSVGREFSENPPGTPYRAATDLSYLGSAEGVIGVTGVAYGIARLTHDERLRTTALLGFEALADGGIVQGILKASTLRERPTQNNGSLRIDDARGRFWTGGASFPSGHSMAMWSLASVLASQYPDKPVVRYCAYGFAAAISASRLPARQHFPSDVLVGSVLGYLIGHYVGRHHR